MGRSQATKYAEASGNRDSWRDRFTVWGGIDNPGAGTDRHRTECREGGRGDTRSEAETACSRSQAEPGGDSKPAAVRHETCTQFTLRRAGEQMGHLAMDRLNGGAAR